MAEQTAALRIKYTGDSRGLVTETKQAERAMDRYGREVKQTTAASRKFGRQSTTTTGSMKKLTTGLRSGASAFVKIGAVATLAAVALGVRFVGAAFKTVDALGKQAKILGITTEALAALNLASNVSGISQDKVTGSMKKLSRSLLDAESGLTTYTRAFDALNLNTETLIKLAPDEAIFAVGQALTSVENPTIRLALAQQILGRSGSDVLNFLSLGTEGMQSFRDATVVAGTALSADMVKKVEDANDAMTALKELGSGLAQQLAVKLGPVITAIANTFFETAKEAGGMGEVASSVFDSMISGAAFVINAIDGFVRVTKLATIGFKFLGGAFAKAINFMIKVLQDTPAGITVRAFMAAWGFFKGEGFELPDYRNSAMAKVLDEFELDIAGMADEVERLLEEPLKGDKLVAYVAKATEGHQELIFKVGEYQGVLIETDSVLKSVGQSASDAAKKASNAWGQAATQMQGFINQIIGAFGGTSGGQANQLFNAFIQGSNNTTSVGGAGGFLSAIGGAGGGGAGGGGILASLGGTLASSFLQQNASGVLGGIASGAAFGLTQTGTSIVGALGGQTFGFAGGAIGPGTAGGGLQVGTLGTNIIGGLATAGAGFAGGFAGNAVGEALFGRTAENNFGSIAGGIGGAFVGAQIGSIGGPLGALIGAAIGALVDVAFGGDGRTRSVLGVATGSQTTRPNAFRDERATSGLRLRAVANRAGGEFGVADQLFDAFLLLDQALTALTTRAGGSVDFTNTVLGTSSGQAGHPNRSQDFFGSFGFNGLQGGNLAQAADQFVGQWLDEVNEQLPRRVRQILHGVNATAVELVAAFEAALSIDELLDLDVVNRTADALENFGVAAGQTLFDTYNSLTTATIEYANNLDGTALALQVLNDSLFTQKQVAAELAFLYQGLQIEIESATGSAIQAIRESLLNDEELYAARVDAIAQLNADLANAVSPEEIGAIFAAIERLTTVSFRSLAPDQQAGAADAFVAFLEGVAATAQAQLTAGLGQLETSETDLQAEIDNQLAAAVDRFGGSVDTFSEAVALFIAETQRREGGGDVDFDFNDINTESNNPNSFFNPEVNA